MEFHQGKTGCWMLMGEHSEDDILEGFCPFLVVTLIRKYPRAHGMKVHQCPVGSLKEK